MSGVGPLFFSLVWEPSKPYSYKQIKKSGSVYFTLNPNLTLNKIFVFFFSKIPPFFFERQRASSSSSSQIPNTMFAVSSATTQFAATKAQFKHKVLLL